jgi:phosphate transport system substrate-binding protein
MFRLSLLPVYLLVFLLCACSSSSTTSFNPPIHSESIITVDGSSTVYPILKMAADAYSEESFLNGSKVAIHFSGTNRGFEKLISGEADIIGASRPINKKEERACRASNLEFIELLIGYDGIVLAVHPSNTWVDHITLRELQKIWSPEAQNYILSWKQINDQWPDKPIHLYGPGKNSGTYDYFTEAVVGSPRHSREDYTPSEDDNYLVYRLSEDSLGLGFFGYHYYTKNRKIIKAIGLDTENIHKTVFPTDSTIRSNLYKPLSRPLFIYISKESIERDAVKHFLNYLGERLPVFVKNSEYIEPSADQLKVIIEKINKQKTGTDYHELLP